MRVRKIDRAIISIRKYIDNNLLDFTILPKIRLRSKLIFR